MDLPSLAEDVAFWSMTGEVGIGYLGNDVQMSRSVSGTSTETVGANITETSGIDTDILVFAKRSIPSYRCPSSLNTETTQWGFGTASYALSYSIGDGYGIGQAYGKFVRMGSITDGLSYTIAVGEAGEYSRGVGYTSSNTYQPAWIGNPAANFYANARYVHPYNLYSFQRNYPYGFNGGHPGGLHFLAGDGAVHFLSEKINPAVYVSLGTISQWTTVTASSYITTTSAAYLDFANAAQQEWRVNPSNSAYWIEVQGQWK